MAPYKNGYYYLHENSQIIWRPYSVVDAAGGPEKYFFGPYVVRWWKVDNKNEWRKMVVEAKEVDNGSRQAK